MNRYSMKEEKVVQTTNRSSKLTKMVVIALLATVSLVLFFISFPLPLLPPYLKVDLSDVPALIAGMIFSPLTGVLVVFLKNLMYFAFKGATDPIGIPANFIARSEEHTSELQSRGHLVCRLLLEKKNKKPKAVP